MEVKEKKLQMVGSITSRCMERSPRSSPEVSSRGGTKTEHYRAAEIQPIQRVEELRFDYFSNHVVYYTLSYAFFSSGCG